ncbi:OsmC family protein [Actinokineospora iranica]|uniref:Uncharacterized OsmC-related protein n=1 Tax=Actinokineospora iranica TaxID=1271860 RepID=A0A1G6MUI6_9PSEU|nr:OsmC family protein [Actinokineospora iranica]SDC58857.1 Uncharacterized OsmC-related protein [Actinokineospora iranica]
MTVEVLRTGKHSFVACNDRGAEVRLGRVGQEGSFTPVELLLAAAAGCVAVTAEELVLRRIGESARFRVAGTDVRLPGEHELDGVRVDLDLDLSGLDEAGRAELLAVVNRAVDALCTVTRTLKRSTAVQLAPPKLHDSSNQ